MIGRKHLVQHNSRVVGVRFPENGLLETIDKVVAHKVLDGERDLTRNLWIINTLIQAVGGEGCLEERVARKRVANLVSETVVNEFVRQWLIKQGYKYKGILSNGQVPVPDGTKNVLIDHQGVKDYPVIDLIWVEAKGSGVGMSMLLQGFSRVSYAVSCGGGRGLLACPSTEFKMMLDRGDFLRAIGIASERSLGLLDGETGRVEWLT